jgi:hypothetical protein
MTGTPSFRPRFARQLLATAAVWVMAGTAQAQADAPPPVSPPPPLSAQPSGPAQPFSFGLSQTLTHESNLFRDSSDEEEDWTSITALNFALDQPIGRQRLHGNAMLQMNRYREHDELNNTGHELGLQLDWETVYNLSGALGVQSTRRQYRYGLDSTTPFDGRNIESTQSAFAQGRLGGMGEWALQGGFNALNREYSADNFAKLNDLSQWGAEGGIGYRPSPDLGFTALGRYTRISRPDSDLGFGDDVGRKQLELGVVWQATGASRLDARVTRAEEKHSVMDDRSFWTGGIGWDWAPSAKLRFRTQLLRDTEGSSGNVMTPDATMPAAPAGDQVRDAVLWSAQWAASAKINVIGTAQWSRRRFDDQFNADGSRIEDRTTAFAIGLRYSPARSLDLGCDVATEKRETNTLTGAELLVTRPYDSMTAGCNLQFWFR